MAASLRAGVIGRTVPCRSRAPRLDDHHHQGGGSGAARVLGFDGRTPDGVPLLADLQRQHIDTVYIAGLTIEYCVKQTALDALHGGLRVTVLTDGIAGIDAHPGDADRALADMQRAGAEFSTELVSAHHS
jgi:nicotinamidase-related amidase